MSTFLFMPESAYGPTNNCIGIGNVLKGRGHRVVFAAETSWEGKLAALGFEEELVDLSEPPPPDSDIDPGQFWTDFIRDTSPEFRKPTIEQIETFVKPTWEALLETAKYCEPQLRDIIARVRPDVLVEDNVNCFPALLTSGRPFVRIVSCNPLEVRGPDIAPTFSGYPADDRSKWDEFRAAYDSAVRPMWSEYNEWVQSCGAPALPDLDFIHESADLNLYVYPAAIDYTDDRPLGANWQRLQSSVRTTDEPFEVPESLREGPGHLVYLSLGSLGSADVDLMRRLVAVLSKSPNRFIVSKGPLADDFELGPNMWGAASVPQTNVLPLVDLVISHGGNNTTTECFHFGKPMIVLPLFWDQYDNAQRVDETGSGVRLDTYRFSDDELLDAVERLLADGDLRGRLADIGTAIRADDGVSKAAEALIEVANRS